MTHEEFKEKALEMVQYKSEKETRLMRSYSSHETIGNEMYENHLAIFHDEYTMLYILVAKIGKTDPIHLPYTSYAAAVEDYDLIKK